MQKNTKRALAAGALVAAAAGAAGYYFYGSKNAKSNRRIAAKWANDLKRDVLWGVREMGGKMDRATVLKAVDTAVAAYGSARNFDPKELKRAAQELKDNWKEIAIEVAKSGTPRAAKATAKRAAKKAAKKTTKKRRRSA
jgi:hypothetical protein